MRSLSSPHEPPPQPDTSAARARSAIRDRVLAVAGEGESRAASIAITVALTISLTVLLTIIALTITLTVALAIVALAITLAIQIGLTDTCRIIPRPAGSDVVRAVTGESRGLTPDFILSSAWTTRRGIHISGPTGDGSIRVVAGGGHVTNRSPFCLFLDHRTDRIDVCLDLLPSKEAFSQASSRATGTGIRHGPGAIADLGEGLITSAEATSAGTATSRTFELVCKLLELLLKTGEEILWDRNRSGRSKTSRSQREEEKDD